MSPLPHQVDVNPFDDIVGGVASDAADAVLQTVVGFFFGLIAGGVEDLTGELIGAMESTASVSLTGPEFAALADIRAHILGLSLTLVFGFFLLNVIGSMARGEPSAVIRAGLVDLPAALFMTVMFTSVSDIAIRIVDQLSAVLLGDVGEALGQLSGALIAGNQIVAVDAIVEGDPGTAVAATQVGGPVGGLAGLLFALLYMFAAMLVWAQLLIRSALIYVIIVAAPLGFATRASAGARQIARRTLEVTAALIVSKLGIALAFAVGAAIINTNTINPAETGESTVELSSMFIGTVVLLLAAFQPFLIFKMIPAMAAATDMAGPERSPGRAIATSAGLAAAGLGLASRVGSSTSQSPAGSTVGGATSATPTSGGTGSAFAAAQQFASAATGSRNDPRGTGTPTGAATEPGRSSIAPQPGQIATPPTQPKDQP